MSGHSKWAKIKRKKAVTDAKKGAGFTKLAKNITIAARNGKDPDMNPALRTAIDAAKAGNMPKDNIEKAILKGAGELPGVVYEEIMYEGYGPGGSALLIDCVTDNTNRTVQWLRSMLTKAGGSLGSTNSVLYMFEKKGVIRIAAESLTQHDPADVELYAIDAGAEDILTEAEGMTIYTSREQLDAVKAHLAQTGIVAETAAVEWISNQMIELSEADAAKFQDLVDTLEDNEDVDGVYSNVK
jgi:YebC/PmpR family DNA-binding regulatory protein